MNVKHFGTSLPLLLGLFTACNFSGSGKGDGSVIIKEQDNVQLTVCDFSKVKDTLTVPLSELLDDCKLVRFENSDTALFKFVMPVISDNYIGIRQRGAFKLFDHNGKFICDAGAVGQGPGEYQNLYDEAIDEKNGFIYLAPFFGSTKILKYDLKGKFIEGLDFGEKLNKPKIGLNEDGTISVVHLCFKGENTFFAAHVNKDGTVQKYSVPDEQKVDVVDKEGNRVGFNGEIWAYQNVPDFTFATTSVDTVFNYNEKKNKLEPRFVLDLTSLGENKPYSISREMPNHFMTYVWSKGTILVNKKTQTATYVNFVNDYFGNMKAPSNFIKGWFFHMFEPSVLEERIDARLAESNCSDKDRELLEKLKSTLNENDNNVMFIGKLKQ